MTDPLGESTSYTFNIIVSLSDPYLLKNIANVNMHVNEVLTIGMPPIMNDDGITTVTGLVLPEFVSYDSNERTYLVAPIKKSHIGTSTVKFTFGDNDYSFKIKVKNDPPMLS